MGIAPILGGIETKTISGTLHDHYNSQLANSLESMEQQRLMLQNLQRTGKQQQWVNEQLARMNVRPKDWNTFQWDSDSLNAAPGQVIKYAYYGNLGTAKPNSNIKLGENYVADRDNEWADRDREARRVLRNYWSIRVGNNTYYKNLRDYDDFLSNLAEHILSNIEYLSFEKIQQIDFDYLIEQANEQALRRLYKGVAETVSRCNERINETSIYLNEEIRRDQERRTCTQEFIDQL